VCFNRQVRLSVPWDQCPDGTESRAHFTRHGLAKAYRSRSRSRPRMNQVESRLFKPVQGNSRQKKTEFHSAYLALVYRKSQIVYRKSYIANRISQIVYRKSYIADRILQIAPPKYAKTPINPPKSRLIKPDRASVAAGILACRGAGLPARRKKTCISQGLPGFHSSKKVGSCLIGVTRRSPISPRQTGF